MVSFCLRVTFHPSLGTVIFPLVPICLNEYLRCHPKRSLLKIPFTDELLKVAHSISAAATAIVFLVTRLQ